MLGENRPGNPMLAANLATQLIEMGVRGVIAAGWRVLDDAAKLFASTFYEAFLAGETFGEAVLAARRATFDRFPPPTPGAPTNATATPACCRGGRQAATSAAAMPHATTSSHRGR